MPIETLYVEGGLDAQVLGVLLAGVPKIKRGGSKNSLKPIVDRERRETKLSNVYYIRDRDFDFDPQPADEPQAETAGKTPVVLGWHWRRHEIENYLLDPVLVQAALPQWKIDGYRAALSDAADAIREYQAARWAVGCARRSLPPHYELRTRPDDVTDHEYRLPAALDLAASRDWALKTAAAHGASIAGALAAEAVAKTCDDFAARFTDGFCRSLGDVLVWFSGKDLIAGLGPWLASKGLSGAGSFLYVLREWIRANPDRARDLLPEWAFFVNAVRNV